MFPWAPVMYHTVTRRVESFCHTTSALPSPLKSRTPTIDQPGTPADAIQFHPCNVLPWAPVIYQTVACRVVSFCQTRSGLPSPSKSRAATTLHPGTPVDESQLQPNTVVPCAPPM